MRKNAGQNDLPREALELRKEWDVEPVDRSTVPTWMTQLVRDAIKQGALPDPGHPLFAASVAFEFATRCLGDHWCDHCGRIKTFDGGQVLISEPYSGTLTSVAIKELDQFCRAF
jgi:hypothetical protein